MHHLSPIAYLTLSLLLGACVAPTTTVTTTRQISAVEAGTSTNVSAARAVAAFDAVCGASLPNFAGAEANMRSIGVTIPSPDGTPTIYSQTEDLSFQLQNPPGGGRACSMVFGSSDSPNTVGAAFASMGTIVPSPYGPAAVYRGTSAVVVFSDQQTQRNGRRYYNLRMFSGR
jgi:hypothetical protein